MQFVIKYHVLIIKEDYLIFHIIYCSKSWPLKFSILTMLMDATFTCLCVVIIKSTLSTHVIVTHGAFGQCDDS